MDMGNRNLSNHQYLNLSTDDSPAATTTPVTSQQSKLTPNGSNESIRAELVSGNSTRKEDNPESYAGEIKGLLEESAATIPGDITGFPDAFQTTRFWGEVKAIQSPLLFLRAVSDKFCSGFFSLDEACNHIRCNFAGDEARLAKWKQGIETLAGLKRWLPSFNQAYDYLTIAFPLGIGTVDSLRNSLLHTIEEPHRFLDPQVRNEFDDRFLEFKKNYMDSYFVLHEDALHAMAGLKKDEAKVDAVALRNLDLLSGLEHMDPSYLNRVKLFAKWIQHGQCNLPLHQILEHYPRCYCNFNPGNHRRPADFAAQINSIIEEGLEHFRTVLQKCSHWITPKLNDQPIDSESRKQITALLSDGPMIPLKASSIKALNRIIAGNSATFLSEIRKASAPGNAAVSAAEAKQT